MIFYWNLYQIKNYQQILKCGICSAGNFTSSNNLKEIHILLATLHFAYDTTRSETHDRDKNIRVTYTTPCRVSLNLASKPVNLISYSVDKIFGIDGHQVSV